MKITYLGQDISPRKPNGRYTKKSRWYLYLAFFAVAIVAFNTHFNNWYSKEITYEAVQTVYAGVTMESKVEAMKESILDRLASCESGGRNEEDGITHLDSNDVGSYGAFQFQRKTVMHFYEKMTGNEINGRDAIILAMTPDKARDLARFVIFGTSNGVAKDWVNCSKKHNLQAEVDFIKKLTN